MNETKSGCFYCHQPPKACLDECPYGSPVAIQIWESARNQARLGNGPAHPDDPTYMCGYRAGELQRDSLVPTVPEDHLHPPAHAPNEPSPAQVVMIIHDKELAARMADPF